MFSCSSQGEANGVFTSYYSLLLVDAAQVFTYPLLDSMDRHVLATCSLCLGLSTVWTHENFAQVTFLNPHYKLSKALNKVSDCMGFQSTSFVGSILPGSTASRAVTEKDLRLCALESIVTVGTSMFYLLAELCMCVTGRGRIEWVSKKLIHPAVGLLVLGLEGCSAYA